MIILTVQPDIRPVTGYPANSISGATLLNSIKIHVQTLPPLSSCISYTPMPRLMLDIEEREDQECGQVGGVDGNALLPAQDILG